MMIKLLKDLGRIVERFLGIVHVDNTHAQSLKKMPLIINFYKE